MASIIKWNNPRPNKRLLVIDIDLTLAQFGNVEPINSKISNMRKHMQFFLTMVYRYYDIVVWSGTEVEFVLEKLTAMDMLENDNYKLLFILDVTHMVPVNSLIYGRILVKPLSVIWENYKEFDEKNTIMVDDQHKNFFLHPSNGLTIKPYFNKNHDTDNELLALIEYLEILAKPNINISQQDLKHWKLYLQK